MDCQPQKLIIMSEELNKEIENIITTDTFLLGDEHLETIEKIKEIYSVISGLSYFEIKSILDVVKHVSKKTSIAKTI